MNFNGLTQPFFRTVLVLQKHAPTIAFVGGMAGVVGSTGLACRATLKLAEKLPEMQDSLDDVRAMNENGEHRKDVVHVYLDNAMTVTQLYAPAVILGAASLTALTGSHVVLNRRNAGLTAGYAALSEAYDAYRERAREELGPERETELYRGIHTETFKDSSGKDVKVKVVNPNKMSVYARCFDECSSEWSKSNEINRNFVQCQQNWFNQLLQVRGHVFLNEVYDNLGFERTSAGQMVGWVIGEDGDNHIDFGMFESVNTRFMNNIERSIWLDFNVDGVIYDKI